MADVSDKIKYLLDALRTNAAPATTTPLTGPRAGVPIQQNQNLGPIEQRRDGYRMYAQEKSANGESPMSYQEWIAQEQ